ncbi:DUF397 domain-containing protein [Micromonospora sp. NPDC047134]
MADGGATRSPAVTIRDSKDRQGPTLAFTADQWTDFVQRIKSGKFDA